MKKIFKLCLCLMTATFIISIFNACKPEPEPEPQTPGSVKVTTSSVSNITETSAKCGGTVTASGYSVGACGLCYSELPNPTVSSYITSDQVGTGTFTSTMSGLEPGTKYYVRAYATTSSGTLYGEQKEFTTLGDNNGGDDDDDNGGGNGGDNEEATKPTVTTNSVSNITFESATCGGNVTDDGGANVTARGVCWSTSQNPTIYDNKTTDGSSTGIFTSQLCNLSENTKYYVRAYATNEKGTSYGEQKSFTTSNNTTLPSVTTNSVSNITFESATCGGNVTDDGGANVTARGVCWSTSQNPTISDNKTTDGSGTGSFISNLINLNENTTYYVRAYATNEKGTSYGEQKSFKTGVSQEPSGYINGYAYVDLGLPSGLKWATCNVGADSPEDYGDYFAWGETIPKNEYHWSNYQHWIDSDGNGYWGGDDLILIDYDISGSVQYDAARANWGESWRMPTQNEIQELVDNCTWTWTTQGGKDGCKVMGPNGNSIFLPAAGYRSNTSLYQAGERGAYRGSTPIFYDSLPIDYLDYEATSLDFTKSNHRERSFKVYSGIPVRPVSE